MFRFKNFKILLLLMLFALSGQDACGYAGTWFNFKAALSKTGEGRIYGSFVSKEKAVNKEYEDTVIRHRVDDTRNAGSDVNIYTPDDVTLHLYAVAEDGWEFVEWQDNSGNKLSTSTPCDANGDSTTESSKYGYASIPKFHSENVCGRPYGPKEGDAEGHQTQHKGEYKYNYYTRVDAYYKAVFLKLENDPVVTAQPLDETLGLASFSPGDNQVGDIVTIATHPTGAKDKGYENKFIGWQHNGEFLRDDQDKIIRDNPYTFEVTEDNAGVYYAVYESGYLFYRIKNFVTKDYFDAISDNVTGTGLVACERALSNDFILENDGTCKAGSIYQIHSYKNTDSSGRLVYDLEVQNKHTKDYYSLPSAYIRINQDVDKNAWNFSTSNDDGQGARLRVNEEGVQSISSVLDDRSLWYIEPMDKDLNTKENYFSLDPDPAKLVEVDGKYYTTLRTSWNILFNPEQMTPYVVTEVDEVNGTFDMEPISGNIIPAGTPVIIETKSNDVEENRMVPTKKAEASGAVPSGNQLVSSTKYFPNQSVAVANNYKKLMVNDNGQLAFGGNALSTVNGNEAYLRVDKEVVKIPILHLADIERDGIKNKHYTIADTLIAVDYCHVDGTEDVYLWCKDQKNASIFPTNKNEDQIDFMRQGGNDAPQKGEWDQSNWVVLKLTGPDGLNKAEEAVPTINGQKQKRFIKEKTVTGKYIDDKNFMIEVENNNFTVEEGEASYTPNVYATTNFLLENLNIWGDERDGGYTSGNPNQNYFFMNPKIQEVCTVTYAVWDKDRSMFVVPSSSGFTGSINVAWDYNEPLGVAEALTQVIENSQVEIAYNFLAVVNRTDFGYGPGFEPSKSTSDNPLLVYPLNLDPANENNVITAIDGVQSGKTITRVVYYNLIGVESDKPHPGINIVETRYSDGTRTTTKIIR